MDPLLVRVEEAARLLGLGRSKVYELVGSGELRSVAIGRSRRIPASAIREWLDAKLAAERPDRPFGDGAGLSAVPHR